MELSEVFLELIRRGATDLPPDVERALVAARDRETGTPRHALQTILDNVALARENSVPMCQDTGAPIFWVSYPPGASQIALRRQIEAALREATARAWLRPNAVDCVTGRNSGDNTGPGAPTIHWEERGERAEDSLRVQLLLKGGGSENVSAQYKLPDTALSAGRNLEGVRRAVIDAVFRAQGKGCAPGVVGVGIGGSRDSGFEAAKHALLRPLDAPHPVPALAELENRLHADLDELGIGPMGFGGKTTVLGVLVGALHRHPACYFVSIGYICWACRRKTVVVRDGEVRYGD